MLFATLFCVIHIVFSNRYLDDHNNHVEERLFKTIAMIKENNKQLEINEDEVWEERTGATMISVVMNAAYTLALRAVKKMIDASDKIVELETLNQVFALIDSKFQNRNLTISLNKDQMKINFASTEAFENKTSESTPFSIRYLPVITVLYNANYKSDKVFEVFKKACEQFNPIKIVQHLVSNLKLSVREYPSANSVLEKLIALHNDFIIDQTAIYAQSISFTECIALSQKNKLDSQEPLVISQALPQFSIALNILRKKYFLKAQVISAHTEL